MLTYDVMILAAGRGQRMQPLTDHTPKPLLKVGGKPLIVWHLERLAAAGVRRVVVNVAWLAEQMIEVLGDGSQWGLELVYSLEQKVYGQALETAGGIAAAWHQGLLSAPVLMAINADVWMPISFDKLSHAARIICNYRAHLHLFLVKNPDHHLLGDFSCEAGRLAARRSDGLSWTFSGVGVYRTALFQELPLGHVTPLRQVLQVALDQQTATGEIWDGDWVDVGTPERLQALDEHIRSSITKE